MGWQSALRRGHPGVVTAGVSHRRVLGEFPPVSRSGHVDTPAARTDPKIPDRSNITISGLLVARGPRLHSGRSVVGDGVERIARGGLRLPGDEDGGTVRRDTESRGDVQGHRWQVVGWRCGLEPTTSSL